MRPHPVKIGLFSATMLVMGSLIGSGVFKKAAPMTLNLQAEGLVLLCWLSAGIITLFGALTFAEIGSRIPNSGGMYSYLRVAYGRPTAFLFGWGCFVVMQSGSFASMSYVFAESICALLDLKTALAAKLIAAGTIWLLTLFNYRGISLGALIQNVFTIGKIFGIFFVVILGVIYFRVPVDFSLGGKAATSPELNFTIGTFFASMLSAFWAYDGFSNIGFIGEEVDKPSRNIPRALIFGVTGVILLYLLINFAYFRLINLPQILQIAQTKNSVFAIEAVRFVLGTGGALVMVAFVCVSTFGCANGSILSSARIYSTMAGDGLFFKSWGQLHPRYNSPHRALLGQALWGTVLVFSGTFDELTDRLIFASFIFYGISAFSIWQLRARKIGAPTYQVPSLIVAAYALFCVVLLSVIFWTQTWQALSGILLIAIGIPVYYYWNKQVKN